MTQPSQLQAQLQSEVEQVEWAALRPHFARGALILVGPGVPLVKAAMAVALDLVADVEGWLRSGDIVKVDDAQAAAWEAADEVQFRFLIVQPYVLIQPATLDPSTAN